MKKNKFYLLFALLLAIAIGQTLNAQTNKDEIDYMQSIFGMEKKAAIAEFLNIGSDAFFWTLYDAYETERKELGKKRLDLLEKYANNYVDMPDVITDQLISDIQTQRKSLDKLIDTYYKKMKKESGSKVAAQFYQFENYILARIRLEVLDSVPFIGELE